MGRSPGCSKDGLNKGAWAASEDNILRDYIKIHGEGKWSNIAKKTGLKRCGKSCRLRWMNYLRPDIKRGNISNDEEELIIRLHKLLGNRWSLIAGRLPGRTDNEIKNYWNTNLAKRAPDLSETKTPKTRADDDLHKSNPDSEFGMPNNAVPCNNKNFDQNPNPSSNYNLEAKDIRTYDNVPDHQHHHQSCDGSGTGPPSSLSRENHNSTTDLIMDFNVEDFYKIFEPDDYGTINDHDVNYDQTTNSLVDGDIIDVMMCCKAEDQELPSHDFPEKVNENGSNTGSDRGQGFEENQRDQTDMDSEFLTLASSFLESADEEWPAYDLNISTHVA